jgi:hypothetical protein
MAEEVEGEAKASDEKNMLFPVTLPTLLFHVIMMVTCLYYGMLFTNWGDAVISGSNDGYFSSALFSMWVKIVSLWITLALFTVSITLNICCPNRIL